MNTHYCDYCGVVVSESAIREFRSVGLDYAAPHGICAACFAAHCSVERGIRRLARDLAVLDRAERAKNN